MLPGKTYTVDDVLQIAKKRIWWLLLPLAVVSAVTAVVARRLPDSYQSDALIVVVPQQVPETFVKSTVTIRIEERLQTIRQQVLSRTLLEETIKAFNLYAEQRKAGAIMADVVDRMRREVGIDVFRGGESFKISYVGQDPRTVTKVTEYLTNAFINQSLKDRSTLAEGTSRFLQNELEEAKRRLLDDEQKLEAYNLKHSGELPTQQTSNLQAASNLQLQSQAVLMQISSLQDRRRAIQQDLSDLQTVSRLFPVDPSPIPPGSNLAPGAGTAAQRLAFERVKLTSLLEKQRYTEEHPDVQASRREIARLEREAEAEALRQPIAEPAPKGLSPAQYQQQKNIENMKSQIEDLGKQIEQKQAEEQRLRALSNTYQNRADMAPLRATELVELTRDYATHQAQYNSLLAKQGEAKIAANLEARAIGEQFRLLDPARVPEKPIKPNRPMINLMGIAGGLALGLALVALLEYRDSSFKTDAEIANVLTLPVLAVVPLMQSDEDRLRTSRRRLVVSVGLGGTVLGCLALLVYTFVR
jgi:polysaccharide chain length determinant protein (PEP-CTERM system associated)